MCGFHTRCLYWVSRQPSPRSNYSASPPMKLMTSQSLPPSSASSVMIMSHSIDLAELAQRKISLTLLCYLTKTLIKVTKPPLPTLLVYTQGRANKRVLKNADVRACSAFTGGIDERFVRRSKNALKGKYRHKNLDCFFCQRKVRKAKVFQTELMLKSPQTKYAMLL